MNPRIPMQPEELPQQRLYVVQALPEKPASFVCGFTTYGAEAPAGIAPPRVPRSARYLGMVEWSWSPMHSRLDAYYLSTNRQRSHWLLWVRWHNDRGLPWRWEDHLWAFGPKLAVPARTAAVHLLLEAWQHELRHGDLDRYHWIDAAGMLTVAEFQAIADRVWRREEDDDDA